MMMLLIAGIGMFIAGLAAIGFGIPVQEFSFGNTLILAGTVAACTGAMLLGVWVAVREIKDAMVRPDFAGAKSAAVPKDRRPPVDAPVSQQTSITDFSSDHAEPQISAIRHYAPSSVPEPPEPEELAETEIEEATPPAKPRRNLLFASSSRKERERAAAKTPETETGEATLVAPAAAPPLPGPAAQPPSFDDAWPASPRRGDQPAPRARATVSSAAAAERYAPQRSAEQPPVTVLKSGIVDGMAYSLYSDGSIEAQMPEGMMRFTSIDELRSHLDQRP